MASARDQVEAYNFATRRQVLALLKGDETATLDPRRRLNRSFFGSLLLGVVALAGVGVAGFFSGGSAAGVPKDGVIVASDTGGAYVLVDNILHPALEPSGLAARGRRVRPGRRTVRRPGHLIDRRRGHRHA